MNGLIFFPVKYEITIFLAPGKMPLSSPLGITRCMSSRGHAAFSSRMAGYWPRSFFCEFMSETESRFLNTPKKSYVKNVTLTKQGWLLKKIENMYRVSIEFYIITQVILAF